METAVTNRSETPPARSAPVITIFASTPLGSESTDKDSIPCVIIEHVGTVPSSPTPPVQSPPDVIHKCDDCDYSSHNKHYLKQHIDLVHNPERPYKCPFCDYAGKRSHSLREHLVVHTNERPYECEHCNASFRKKGHLTNHIKLHTTQKLIKCSLCSACLADQEAFEKHLKQMHKTDKIFACELCDFVAGDQEMIVKHIHTHDKVFKCSDCSFVTADINKLASHADMHMAKVARSLKPPLPPSQHSGQTVRLQGADQSKPPFMMKCTECGFTAPNADTMKSHMWKHIKAETKGEKMESSKTADRPTNIPQPVAKEIRIIEAVLPDNAAYKCTECSFVHKEATVFIKHMLSHRVKSVEKTEEEKCSPEDKMAAQRLGQTYMVTPVTKENTCKNAENTPFTHDATTGRFRCIICGYTCEYQRTIKAHIWKHSGNKAIDYPMFQNGPLSMYDDVPTPKGLPEDATLEIVEKSIPVAAHEEVNISKTSEWPAEVKITKPPAWTEEGKLEKKDEVLGKEKILKPVGGFSVEKTGPESRPSSSTHTSTAAVTHVRSVTDNTVTNIKLVKTDIGPKTLGGGTAICQMQTVDGKTLALVRETGQKSLPEGRTTPTSSKVVQILTESAPIVPFGIEETVTTSDLKSISSPDSTQTKSISNLKLSVQDSLSNLSKSPVKSLKPLILAKSKCPTAELITPPKLKDVIVQPPGAADLSKMDKPYHLEDAQFLQVAKRICSEKETGAAKSEEVCVVVESVDSVSSAAGFTGMKSQQNSPRVMDQSQQDEWTDADAKTPPPVASQQKTSPSMITRARSRQALKAAKEKSEKEIKAIQAKQLALLEKASKEEEDAKEVSGPITRAKKHCEEAITLLSLLKKGPNVNPVTALQNTGDVVGSVKQLVAPSQSDSETESEDELISEDLSSESSKPKTGICSSLLAVIEQLRERSKSESETDESINAKNLPGRRQSRRKSRRESNEDEFNLDSIENMEKIEEDGETKYRCKLCHYSNSRTLLIRLHMRLHKSKKPFECSLCDFIAGSSEALQEHMIRHCKMRTYPCKLCPSTFNYKSQLRAHMRAHSDKDPLICHMCDFETNDPMAYRTHLRFHADQYYHKCDLCNKLFVTKSELRSHKQELCYKDQPESIEDSDATDSDYEVPKEMMIKKENLKCSQCEFTTTSVAVFTDHARIHEETKTLKCELCDFTAVSSRSLKSHMKRHINDQRYVQQPLEQYKCNLCGYVCHHLPSLKSHMWRHASDRNYSYEFTNDVINAAIDYDCRIDSSTACDPDMLEKILISEKKILEGRLNNSLGPDGRQPVCWVVFKCCQCGFETINKAQLNVHMRSHSDIIQRTLEVSQSLARPLSCNKRPAPETLPKGDHSHSKIVKTQDHG